MLRSGLVFFFICLHGFCEAQTPPSSPLTPTRAEDSRLNNPFLSSAVPLFQQNKDTTRSNDISQYVARYQFTFVTDSTNRNKVYKEKFFLYMGKISSWFVSSILIERHKLIEEGAADGRPFGFSLTDPDISRLQTDAPQFFKWYGSGIIKEERSFFRPFIWDDTIKSFDWHLKTDTLDIKGYSCNSAEVDFKGRRYTAWYTHEIPISEGPYKFYGLPGLIIKIVDSKREVSFEMEGFEKSTEANQMEFEPNKWHGHLIETTKQQYDSLYVASFKDPIAVGSWITGHATPINHPIHPRHQPISKNSIEIEK